MSEMKLTLTDSDALNDFKVCFDGVLQRMLSSMMKDGDTEGTVTAKLKVNIINSTDNNGEGYIRPVITHDVSSTIQKKDGEKGFMAGDYALEFDRKTCRYVIVPSDDAQTSMFD